VTQLKQYLFRYQGHIGAYLIVAGVDPTGTHLFACQAHGSTDKLPYMTLGSGSLAAMSVLECEYRFGMTKEEAMDLVCRAVLGGVWNDLGSGGSVDLVIMEKDKVGFPLPKCSNKWMLKGRFCSRRKFYGLIIRQIRLPLNSSHISLVLGLPRFSRRWLCASLLLMGKLQKWFLSMLWQMLWNWIRSI